MTDVSERVDVGIIIDYTIKQRVDEVLSAKENEEIPEYVNTDNIGEVIEKLVILHIRTWMLEDAIQDAKSDVEVAEIKRKLDVCFKQKRPRLVEAINLIIDNAVVHEKRIAEQSVKLYKNIEKSSEKPSGEQW